MSRRHATLLAVLAAVWGGSYLLIKYALDGIFSFSYRPLRWVTYMGFTVSALSFTLAVLYLIQFILRIGEELRARIVTRSQCQEGQFHVLARLQWSIRSVCAGEMHAVW